ncbi:hypothetical protein L345_08030, partial [Ophiophagus hannah]
MSFAGVTGSHRSLEFVKHLRMAGLLSLVYKLGVLLASEIPFTTVICVSSTMARLLQQGLHENAIKDDSEAPIDLQL